MAITYATINGRVTLPGTEAGIRATVIATPKVTDEVLTFPTNDILTTGSVSTRTTPNGTLSPALKIPTSEGATGVVWEFTFKPDSNIVKPWTRRYAISASARLEDLVETEALVVSPTLVNDVTNIAAGVEADRVEVVAHRTAVEAVVATNDGIMAAAVNNDASLSNAALKPRYLSRPRTAVRAPSCQSVTKTALTGGIRFVDQWDDGTLLGCTSTGVIHTSLGGGTWTQVCATHPGGDGFFHRIVPTDDGEVITVSNTEIRKSSGWSTNPATATWSANKIVPNGVSVFQGFGFDGDGTKFILCQYAAPEGPNWADSRYAHVSLDSGTTWTMRYDSDTLHPTQADTESHLHLACYDPWGDVFYVGEGHGPAGGIYWSDDDGLTWGGPISAPGTGASNDTNAPTFMMATDDGFVIGTDNNYTGLMGMIRRPNPADQRITLTWVASTGHEGLVAFAQRGVRDPDSGLVYVSFRPSFDDVPIFLAAGTPSSGGLVYRDPKRPTAGGADRYVAMAVIKSGTELFWYGEDAATGYHYRGTLPRPGNGAGVLDRPGNIEGGTSHDKTTIAVGGGAYAAPGIIRTLASGAQAEASDTGSDAVALGQLAKVTANGAIAIGSGAQATVSDTIALGKNVVTDKQGQAKLGNVFLDVGTRTMPLLPETGRYQLILIEDGQGLTPARSQLVVQFPSGARQIIATERGFRDFTLDTAHALTDHVLLFKGTAARTLTLLAAAGRPGCKVTVKNASSNASVLTVTPAGGNIDGAASATLNQWQKGTYLSDGSNWLTI